AGENGRGRRSGIVRSGDRQRCINFRKAKATVERLQVRAGQWNIRRAGREDRVGRASGGGNSGAVVATAAQVHNWTSMSSYRIMVPDVLHHHRIRSSGSGSPGDASWCGADRATDRGDYEGSARLFAQGVELAWPGRSG